MNSNRLLTVTLACLILLLMTGCFPIILGGSKPLSEYAKYVHDYVNVPPYGNWTFIEKPVFPVYWNHSQVPVGSNWTVIVPLKANHTYHIYCFGEWIDFSSEASTDYDIHVFDPNGELEGYHTESVGLPEHLGTTVDKPFFTPKNSGNYSFVLINDPKESNDSQPASLMIIENVNCNVWHEAFIEGKSNDESVFNTGWAFEFVTEARQIEVLIKVPDALDMYEARLYMMANPAIGMAEILNGVPLAWESGLYGNVDPQMVGGYNLDSKDFRGVAYASCEFHGQRMTLNYTSPFEGETLYHLVLIGEEGAGNIEFLIRTEHNASLTPVNPLLQVYAGDETTLTFTSEKTTVTKAILNHSINGWHNATSSNMTLIDGRLLAGIVPGQPAGTIVHYNVEATDVLENKFGYSGSYMVKSPSQLNITLRNDPVPLDEYVTLIGSLKPSTQNQSISLVYSSSNGTFKDTVSVSADGTFQDNFKSPAAGNWVVKATFEGDRMTYGSSMSLTFKVGPPSFMSQYSTYVWVGLGLAIAVMAGFYIKKRRE